MRLILLFILALPFGLRAQTFTDVAVASGIDFQPIAGSYMGGGVAWLDYDNDGWQDLYFTGCKSRDRLYRNLGDGTFEEVSEIAGLSETEDINTLGVTAADYDRDGDTDVFVTTWQVEGENTFAPNYLFQNNGDGTFTNVAVEAGVDGATFSVSATFLDINRDGYADLWVGNYVIDAGFLFDEDGQIIGFDHVCETDYVYLNNGNGTFTDLSAIYEAQNQGCTLATRATDIDLDGDSDMIVANDFGEWGIPNKLYRNGYPLMLFSEIGSPSGAAGQMYAMGVASGDYDRDGDLDHYITNLGRNLLMEKQEDVFYIDRSTEAGVENAEAEGLRFTSWATGFADFDHDGWEDLFVVNGHVPTIPAAANHVFDPDVLYHNNGDGTFANIAESAGFDDLGIGRGGAYCDYDQDGDLDLAVSNIWNPASEDEEGVRLHRNDGAPGNWVQFSLEGTDSNPDAFGARLEVFAGEQSWIREVSGGGDTHASRHALALHIGLGAVSELDSAVVHWPSGAVETWENPSPLTHHVWIEGTNTDLSSSPQQPQIVVFPTPAHNRVNVLIPGKLGGTYQVLDVTGREVHRETWTPGTHTIEVSTWASGSYWLVAENAPEVKPVRLLIQSTN